MSSELDLIRRFREKRDEASFRLIYREVTPAVYRYVLRFLGSDEEAADVVQETWMRAITNLNAFGGRSSFKTWLTGISINCCREIMKKKSRWEDIPEEEADYYQKVETPIDMIDLEKALSKLPTGYREILLLHDLEGYKHHEIAELLGIKDGTSKSQLFNARRMMRKFLQK